MSESSGKWLGYVILVLILVSFVGGIVFDAVFINRDPVPEEPDAKFDFYSGCLQDLGYEEIRLDKTFGRSVDKESVSFNEFLWIMEVGNYSAFHYTPLKTIKSGIAFKIQNPKIWIYVDGTYWMVEE